MHLCACTCEVQIPIYSLFFNQPPFHSWERFSSQIQAYSTSSKLGSKPRECPVSASPELSFTGYFLHGFWNFFPPQSHFYMFTVLSLLYSLGMLFLRTSDALGLTNLLFSLYYLLPFCEIKIYNSLHSVFMSLKMSFLFLSLHVCRHILQSSHFF